MKETHNEAVPQHMKEKKDRMTCRICSSRVARNLMSRHLRDVHGIVKDPSSRSIFRGFITLNESTWQPLWLENSEPDPPSEMMVPIKNGKVSVYGVQYEVEECVAKERNKLERKEDVSKDEMPMIDTSALETNKENEGRAEKEDADMGRWKAENR